MSCELLLTNINGSSNLNIDDLGFLDLSPSRTIDLYQFYSISRITDSADLQAALDAGDATLVHAGNPILDLAKLCAFGAGASRILEGFLLGDLEGGTSTDFLRLNSISTADMPFFMNKKTVLTDFTVTAEGINTPNFVFSIALIKIAVDGTSTEILPPTSVTNSVPSKPLTNIILEANEKLRIRFINTSSSTTIRNPTIIINASS